MQTKARFRRLCATTALASRQKSCRGCSNHFLRRRKPGAVLASAWPSVEAFWSATTDRWKCNRNSGGARLLRPRCLSKQRPTTKQEKKGPRLSAGGDHSWKTKGNY